MGTFGGRETTFWANTAVTAPQSFANTASTYAALKSFKAAMSSSDREATAGRQAVRKARDGTASTRRRMMTSWKE
jgi:hypothetical protein